MSKQCNILPFPSFPESIYPVVPQEEIDALFAPEPARQGLNAPPRPPLAPALERGGPSR